VADIATLVRHALAKVCTVPVLVVNPSISFGLCCVYAVCDSNLLEARQNFTATSLSLLRNYRKRQQLTALLKSLRTIKTLVRQNSY